MDHTAATDHSIPTSSSYHRTATGSQGAGRARMVLPITPGQYLKFVLAMTALFFVINFIAAIVEANATGLPELIARGFLLETERSLPTLFNFGLIIANVTLLTMNAVYAFNEGNKWRWHWFLLSLIFVYLAFDEAARIHERFSEIGAMFVVPEGIFRFAWIVPIIPVVIVAGLFFLRFVLSQPNEIMVLMILSGLIYLSGTIGMEMVGGLLIQSGVELGSFGYHIVTGVEETVEMAGMSLFGFTLIKLLNSRGTTAE